MFTSYNENTAWLLRCLYQYARERQEVGLVERVVGEVFFLNEELRTPRIITLLEID